MIVRRLAILSLSIFALTCAAGESLRRFNIDAQPLARALIAFSEQSDIAVMAPAPLVQGKKAPAVSGNMLPMEALGKLLEGSGLQSRMDASGTVLITSPRTSALDTQDIGIRLAQNSTSAEPPAPAETTKHSAARSAESAVPEVLVEGSRLLNTDIKRSRDDAQPYVVFNRETLERSGARNLEEFLKDRLTMNASGVSNNQGPTFAAGNTSRFNLRGLGSAQTLILIDGRRTAGSIAVAVDGPPEQADVNALPVSAIERIEILPTTASGIYGGSATGGVINIILRRDYQGIEAAVTCDGAFEGSAAARRVNLSTGFSLGENTSVMMTGTYSDQETLLLRERQELVDRAISRVLANNPATIFGVAPPVGATPNIRSTNGSNLTLKSGGAALNSPFTFVPYGYTGIASDNGAALRTNAGTYNFTLADTPQTQAGNAAIMAAPRAQSIIATLRHTFRPGFDVFIDGLAGSNKSRSPITLENGQFQLLNTNANNPFNQTIDVTIPVFQNDAGGALVAQTEQRRVSGGAIFRLGHGWRGEVGHVWSRSSFSSSIPWSLSTAADAAVNAGTLNILADPRVVALDFTPYFRGAIYNDPIDSTLQNTNLRVAGPSFALPAGPVQLTGVIEHRVEKIGQGIQYLGNTGGGTLTPAREQSNNSFYAEALVPVISTKNRIRGIQELELQLAARWDDYKVEGTTGLISILAPVPVATSINRESSINPTFALRYQPIEDITLRASYGTGFQPPSVTQITPSAPLILTAGAGVDPKRNNAPTGAIDYVRGGNSQLRPEKSESISAGLILTPRALPGLRLSLDYTHIDKTDNITTLTYQVIIDNEDYLPGRVTRGPKLPGDPANWAGPITNLDISTVNVSAAKIEAFDVALDYGFDTRWGTFNLFSAATLQPHYKTQVTPLAAVIENVDMGALNPLKLKANMGLSWTGQQWSAGWVGRYFGDYMAANPALTTSAPTLLSQGNGGMVPSQHYHDVFVGWRPSPQTPSSMLNGLDVQAGVRNLFNTKPPYDAQVLSYTRAGYSTYGDARLASYYITLRKRFGN